MREGCDLFRPGPKGGAEAMRRDRLAPAGSTQAFDSPAFIRLSSVRRAMLESGLFLTWPGKTKDETRAFSISLTISTARAAKGTRKGSLRCFRSFRLASGAVQTASPVQHFSGLSRTSADDERRPSWKCTGIVGELRDGGEQERMGIWCRLRDSNPRPTVYKTVALPTELNRRCARRCGYQRGSVGARARFRRGRPQRSAPRGRGRAGPRPFPAKGAW